MSNANTGGDFIALVRFEGGAGSWYRDKTAEAAVKGCHRIVKADFGKLLKKGAVVKMALFDVTGHDEVFVGDNGARVGDQMIPVLRVEDVKL